MSAREPNFSAATKLRNARAFAMSYTRGELDALLRACRDEGFALGTASLTYLTRIQNKVQRATIQSQAIKGRWTNKELLRQIRARLGNQKPYAGRRVKQPRDQWELLGMLESICRNWKGHFEALERAPSEDSLIKVSRISMAQLSP
jgi:hypothetical protein